MAQLLHYATLHLHTVFTRVAKLAAFNMEKDRTRQVSLQYLSGSDLLYVSEIADIGRIQGVLTDALGNTHTFVRQAVKLFF